MTMETGAVFARIEELAGEFTAFWKRICDIESPTSDKAGVDAVGQCFAGEAARRGWKCERQEEPVSGDPICLTMNPGAPGPSAVVSGHLDTVHPAGLFGTPPARIEGDRIVGPGVCDCKGGCVAGLLAMAALQDCGFRDRPLKLVLQTDEEVSSRFSGKRTVEFMAECSREALCFLNTERGDGSSLITGRKGILRYEVTVRGRMAHSSVCGEGANAIAAAALLVRELEGIKETDDPKGLTFSVNQIRGGTAVNTVPDECVLVVDIRYPDPEQMVRAERFVKRAAEELAFPGCSAEARLLSRRDAMPPCGRNRKLFEEINRCLSEAGLSPVSERYSLGGSDAADMTSRGIPSVDGMGVRGGQEHTAEEWAYVDSLKDAAKQIAAVMMLIRE